MKRQFLITNVFFSKTKDIPIQKVPVAKILLH
jgi:hypothetical protein